MIGKLDTRRREVTIVGAGIAGMMAAYSLDRRGYEVTLIEASERGGGLINTKQTEFGISETAAHSFLASPVVEGVCRDLGVELTPLRKEGRAKFIYRAGLRKFPLTLRETVSTFKRALTNRSTHDTNGMTMQEWGREFVGDAALRYLLTPFTRGIYGIQPSELGVMAAYPSLEVPPGRTLVGAMMKRRRENREPRVKKLRVAPRHGMNDFMLRLDQHLSSKLGSRFRKGTELGSLPDAANVILSVPACVAADFVESDAPQLAEELRRIDYTPLIAATVFVSRESMRRAIEGTGVLMPENEGRRSLGILFNSSSFEGRVNDESRVASFTVMMGGTSQPRWLDATDDDLDLAIRSELSEVLAITGKPTEIVISRWPRGIPQYSPTLPAVWSLAEQTWCSEPGRLLFGNYTGQVSIRGMIESAMGLCS